jgi:hypothetical protein
MSGAQDIVHDVGGRVSRQLRRVQGKAEPIRCEIDGNAENHAS